mgnify:CR=1 FL=1
MKESIVFLRLTESLQKCHVARMSHAREIFTESNQLHFCRTLLLRKSQITNCCNQIFEYKHINIYKYSNISMCLYKRSLISPLQWKMTPPVENDPTSGK